MSKTKESKDGWIRHRGGKCPVDDLMRVEVRMRGGDSGHERADGLRWNHIGSPGDIMAYRICEPVQAAPEVKITHVDHESGAIHIESASSSCGPVALEWEERELDGPLVWRDRIYELAAQHEEIAEVYNRQSSEIAAERDSLIQRLESEGFRLINGSVEAATHAEDMSDWRNWKVGDLVECVSESIESRESMIVGNLYELVEDDGGISIIDEDGDLMCSVVASERIIWHSRPSA